MAEAEAESESAEIEPLLPLKLELGGIVTDPETSPGDEFAETTEFVGPATATNEYSFAYPVTPAATPEANHDEPAPKSLPLGAIVGGGLMALVPFALAAFLFLYFTGGDDASGDGASSSDAAPSAEELTTAADEDSTETESTSTTSEGTTSTASTTTTASTETTVELTTTPIAGDFAYPVGLFSAAVDQPTGSGCSPGSGALPNGIWFGRIEGWSPSQIDFDLMCAYTGIAAQPKAEANGDRSDRRIYASNVNSTSRSVGIAPGAVARLSRGNGLTGNRIAIADQLDLIANSISLAYIYVNDGRVTDVVMADPSDVTFKGTAGGSGQPTTTDPANLTSSAQQCAEGGATLQPVEVFNIPADDPDGGLNARLEPRLDSQVIRTMPNGTKLFQISACTVDNDGYQWVVVEYDDWLLWAVTSHLRRR